jgi:hypothetical protein
MGGVKTTLKLDLKALNFVYSFVYNQKERPTENAYKFYNFEYQISNPDIFQTVNNE